MKLACHGRWALDRALLSREKRLLSREFQRNLYHHAGAFSSLSIKKSHGRAAKDFGDSLISGLRSFSSLVSTDDVSPNRRCAGGGQSRLGVSYSKPVLFQPNNGVESGIARLAEKILLQQRRHFSQETNESSEENNNTAKKEVAAKTYESAEFRLRDG
mmetsp:Transcript_21135/g.32303  ORF Transcript_21135/g.32303 Transcript_21135/m.32303 type:complete len:158 (-) Transcript_21135:560-1033(-)